jgi:hypothetical protein
MRIIKYSGVAVGGAMIFLASIITFAVHAPVHTSASGWTTTVTVESPERSGTAGHFAVLPSGETIAAGRQ